MEKLTKGTKYQEKKRLFHERSKYDNLKIVSECKEPGRQYGPGTRGNRQCAGVGPEGYY